MPGDFGGDEVAQRITDGGCLSIIDRVGGEQVRGGVDGGVPVAEVDLGLVVDGVDVGAAGVVAPCGVGAGVVQSSTAFSQSWRVSGLPVGSVSQGLWA